MNKAVFVTAAFVAAVTSPLQSWGLQLGKSAPEHDMRVKRILDQEGIKYRINDSGDFVVSFDVGNGRSQQAFINSHTEEYRNFEIREIWSPAYKSIGKAFPVAVANSLLEDSAQKKLGAWSKEGQYALFRVRVAADADAESLISSLNIVLESADEMEQTLSGAKDEY